MSRCLSPRYDSRLVEETVFLALRDRPDAGDFQKQRERAYQVADPDERERVFEELNRSWFIRLGVGDVLAQALQEQPLINTNVDSCLVIYAVQAKEEGAELFVAPKEKCIGSASRIVRILLRPDSLLRSAPLLTFLRRELFHIADMLDPAFAYEPTLPKAEGGPTYDTLITNRYRVLWDITIHGRMTRRGWLSESDRGEQLAYFRHAFPMLKDNAEESFNRFFDADRPTHPELAAFAFDPRNAAGSAGRPCAPGTHCPLCKFPTHSFEPIPDNLGDHVLAAIKGDFENWTPSMGLCAQCADLYRANQLSIAAAKELPGWH